MQEVMNNCYFVFKYFGIKSLDPKDLDVLAYRLHFPLLVDEVKLRTEEPWQRLNETVSYTITQPERLDTQSYPRITILNRYFKTIFMRSRRAGA